MEKDPSGGPESKGPSMPPTMDQQAMIQQLMRANPELAAQFQETARAMQPHKFWDE